MLYLYRHCSHSYSDDAFADAVRQSFRHGTCTYFIEPKDKELGGG